MAEGPGSGLRVLHLAKLYPPAPGGIESHVRTLARGQAARGATVAVACVNHLDRAGRDVTWVRLARTATVEERDGAVAVTRLGRVATVLRLDVCPGLPALLRAHACDVVHVHTPNPTMLLALAACPSRAPLFVTHHSDAVSQPLRARLFRPVETRCYARAARILSDSAAYADGSPVLRRHAARVAVLPLGVELARFLAPPAAALAARDRLRRELGDTIWVAVARLVPYKGLDVALAALGAVPGRLLVVGVGPEAERLARRARDLGVASRVTWAGQVGEDELQGAYLAATALWFPSRARSEGYGLVQVEAMASGCPVINTAIAGSGVPWVSQHGVSGLTVPVDDAGALAAAARRLAAEPDLRARLAASARARAEAELGADLMVERSLELYRAAGVVPGGRGGGARA